MKVRFPLYAQIIGFLVLHLTVLAALFLFFFNAQFGLAWEPLLLSPVGDRVDLIAWVISRQTQEAPVSSWNNVLEEYGKYYGLKFAIFERSGKQLAGEPVAIPDSVKAKLAAKPPQLPNLSNMSPESIMKQPQIVPPHFPQRTLGRFFLHTNNPDCFWIGVRLHRRHSDERPTLLAFTNNLWQSKLFFDFWLFWAGVASLAFLSVLIWWPFVYRVTHTLSELTSATENIAEGKFDTALKASGSDEIGSLAVSINRMAKSLNSFVTGQKRFLGDIAHELCSPVARLQVALELLERSGTPEQEQAIKDIREEAEEMSTLINELLAFSKAGLRGKEAQLVPIDLAAILKDAITKTCPQDMVKLQITTDLVVLGDSVLIERALKNILRNGVRYAGNNGPIDVKVVRTNREVVLTIRDYGPGVPEEALKLLGQPFYRPEPSRSRTSGGVGLGLAIVKTCVEACDGTFRLSNCQPSGLEVTIHFKADAGPSGTTVQPPAAAVFDETTV